MPSIGKISDVDASRICSGQVIVSLFSAVKELVENGLDADATSIDISLEEHGLTSIRVSDNGRGIPASDVASIGKRFHTSKITTFADIVGGSSGGLSTYGFRGEAVHSLIQVASSVVVFTRHASDPLATEVTFTTPSGSSVSTDASTEPKRALRRLPRAVGTTVSINGLFESMPVRRREFAARISHQFAECVALLENYCLVLKPGVRLNCTNVTSKRGQQRIDSVIRYEAGRTLRQRVANLFGSTFADKLTWIDHCSPTDEDLAQCRVVDDVALMRDLVVEGCISSSPTSFGQDTPIQSNRRRHYYSLNGRPCNPATLVSGKVARHVVQVYKDHHAAAKGPFFLVIQIQMPPRLVDCNITPDKRDIVTANEPAIIATVQTSLRAALELDCGGSDVSISGTADKSSDSISNVALMKWFNQTTRSRVVSSDVGECDHSDDSTINPNTNFTQDRDQRTQHTTSMTPQQSESSSTEPPAKRVCIDDDVDEGGEEWEDVTCLDDKSKRQIEVITDADVPIVVDPSNRRTATTVKFCIETCRRAAKAMRQRQMTSSDSGQSSSEASLSQLMSTTVQLDPERHSLAEQQLETSLNSKKDLRRLTICGQFNRGFILATLDDKHLFIIDQHASDEKHTYEKLCATHDNAQLMNVHRLVVPQRLTGLGHVQASTILDNLGVFKANGFSFQQCAADDDSASKHSAATLADIVEQENEKDAAPLRLLLTHVPYYRNWTFDRTDIEELIEMLLTSGGNAGDGRIIRPSRIHAMLASRACRSSVMIGSALNYASMRRILDQLATLARPWNCPHGRPTLRYLGRYSTPTTSC